jgi:hypothetical protein
VGDDEVGESEKRKQGISASFIYAFFDSDSWKAAHAKGESLK